MADIQQWRRMIQPSRTRTSAVDTDESDVVLSPTTPRKGLKPKISSYFTQHTASLGLGKADSQSYDGFFRPEQDWTTFNPAPNPDAGDLVNSVMSRLLAEPYDRLDVRFNGTLLQILESFRHLNDNQQKLRPNLAQEVDRRCAVERTMHRAAEQWDEERQTYKAEVKRLELILCKGERGVAEVTLARQDSLLRRGNDGPSRMRDDATLETIFELLERSKRYEDKMWSSQRATMRKRPTSPSMSMRRLSKTLATQSSAPNAHTDLAFGTPKEMSVLNHAYEVDQDRSPDRRVKDLSKCLSAPLPMPSFYDGDHENNFSNDSNSTFSCDGDLLPDETADMKLIEAAGTDDDFVAMKRIALILARRRHVDPDVVMPKIQQLFDAQSVDKERCRSVSGFGDVRCTSATTEDTIAEMSFAKVPKLRSKASEFFSKWRPQLNVDTSSAVGRRFSFEPGDDADATFSAPPLDTLPAAVKDRLLRKSLSLSVLTEGGSRRRRQERALSPVGQSSTSPSESRRPSRIPTPVHCSRLLARPRQEREDSASSLLTDIKHADDAAERRSSRSASTSTSPLSSWKDFAPALQRYEIGGDQPKAAENRPLLEHTNILRGNAFAAAAAKTASVGATERLGRSAVSSQGKRPRAIVNSNNKRDSTQSTRITDMSEPRKENNHPIGPRGSYGDLTSDTSL